MARLFCCVWFGAHIGFSSNGYGAFYLKLLYQRAGAFVGRAAACGVAVLSRFGRRRVRLVGAAGFAARSWLAMFVVMGVDSLATRVTAAVAAWEAWVPKWHPPSVRLRASICGRCVHSPFLVAAGFAQDVPHQVRHALVVRLQALVNDEVDDFVQSSLPLLRRELDQQQRRSAQLPYRPSDNLAPEFQGLALDPEPVPGEPFLFTLAGLAADVAHEVDLTPLPPLSAELKDALRSEMLLADECALLAGQRVCALLAEHRDRLRAALERWVTPQVEALLDELSRSLEFPDF